LHDPPITTIDIRKQTINDTENTARMRGNILIMGGDNKGLTRLLA
jgi:hypothetical protein